MQEADYANLEIPFYDKKGRSGRIRYADLLLEMGEGRECSLAACLAEEQDRVHEFNRNADRLSRKVRSLDEYYAEIENKPRYYQRLFNKRRSGLNQLSYSKRLQVLNTYYTLNKSHAQTLRSLTNHLLAGSEGDHCAHLVSLIQRSIDLMCQVMRKVERKSKRASALHSLEAARGAAKNGLRVITIIPTLLHDVVEEDLDIWTKQMVENELKDPIYGDCCGLSMRQAPPQLRHLIIQKHIDEYNDKASTIFFKIALILYDHIRHFPQPARYYETVHSIMQILAALSRRRDMSYYTYLRELLYPKANAVLDTIEHVRLGSGLQSDFIDADTLLSEYNVNVHNFYETALGVYASKDEVRRNAFREILAKILDRLNNTRDMDRSLGFSIPNRIYGTGFKNIFFLQALEDKFRKPSFNTEERRLIEVKFINKPKIASLYQCLDDIAFLRREHLKPEILQKLHTEMNNYRKTNAFRRITLPGKPGNFNGLVYLFNEITLGRKSKIVELEKRPAKQAEVLIAFKAVIESYLVYPNLIRRELKKKGLRNIRQSKYRPYRIIGLSPGLEQHSTARQENAVDLLNLKTFSRRIV